MTQQMCKTSSYVMHKKLGSIFINNKDMKNGERMALI